MNLEKIRLASEQFKKEKMSDYYNTEAIWLALNDLFDALLDSVAGDGSIDRATDGRISEEPVVVLPQEILADGCDSDPADDGPEVCILRDRQPDKKMEKITANQMLDMIRGSLRGYPNAGGDIEVMAEVERIEKKAYSHGWADGARIERARRGEY